MLHHISFSVADLNRSEMFYDVVLGALGYKRVCETKSFIGYGTEANKDKFAIAFKEVGVKPPCAGFHLAFSAPDGYRIEAVFND
jgi:catechol 2,3-dioxygenase-like lactoylglutathione lyase family enzyme